MKEQILEIAIRLKGLREIEGISASQMAELFSIDQSKYLEYESGNVDIPVSFLYEVANKFNITLVEILTGESPKLHKFQVVRKDKGLEVERRKKYKYQNLAFNFIHKKAEPFLVTVPLNDEPIALNSHPGQEYNFVIEGSMQVVIDGNEVVLNEGDSIYFDSTCKHGMKATGGKSAKFLAIIM